MMNAVCITMNYSSSPSPGTVCGNKRDGETPKKSSLTGEGAALIRLANIISGEWSVTKEQVGIRYTNVPQGETLLELTEFL